jgi:hypothetical protein
MTRLQKNQAQSFLRVSDFTEKRLADFTHQPPTASTSTKVFSESVGTTTILIRTSLAPIFKAFSLTRSPKKIQLLKMYVGIACACLRHSIHLHLHFKP